MNFIIGAIFISIVSTLLHFTYELSGHNKVVGLFSAVNESTWEHIKITLTAVFLWSLYDGFIYFSNPNYFSAKLVSLLVIIFFIPALFYGYTSIFKKPILPIDITGFYVSIILSQLAMKQILSQKSFGYSINFLSVILLTVIFGIYILSSLMPLKNFLFLDPITKKFGEKGHGHIVKK